MGIPILILGESGTGKSASMRNFKPDEIALANVAGKPLPFRGKFEETINTDSYRQIKKFMKESFADVVVIDDAQYLMANEFMRRSGERGYDKFTEIGVNFWDLVRSVIDLPPDKIVVFMAHIDRDANGNEKIKTIGKLLDEKITVEGMFTIVLKTSVSDGKFSFMTVNNGHDTVKSPIGLFKSSEIENDLKAVINAVRAYYGGGEDIEIPFTVDDDPEPEQEQEQKKRAPRKDEKKDNGEAEKEKPKDTPKEESETPRRTRRTRKER